MSRVLQQCNWPKVSVKREGMFISMPTHSTQRFVQLIWSFPLQCWSNWGKYTSTSSTQLLDFNLVKLHGTQPLNT